MELDKQTTENSRAAADNICFIACDGCYLFVAIIPGWGFPKRTVYLLTDD